jgi:hypothetical protein
MVCFLWNTDTGYVIDVHMVLQALPDLRNNNVPAGLAHVFFLRKLEMITHMAQYIRTQGNPVEFPTPAY